MRSLRDDEVVQPRLSYIVTQGSAGTARAAMQPHMIVIQQPQVDVTEQELIRRVRDGDKEAFYGLVRPYERAVFFAARSVLNNDADAEEAAQEAVLKAFMHIGEFRGESKFSTWLVQIAINEARMKLRKEHRELYESMDESTADDQGDYRPKDFADGRKSQSRLSSERNSAKRSAKRWRRLRRSTVRSWYCAIFSSSASLKRRRPWDSAKKP